MPLASVHRGQWFFRWGLEKVKSESKTRDVGIPSECVIVRLETEKDLQQTKREDISFVRRGSQNHPRRFLAQSINMDITDSIYGARQWDILKTECDTLNVYQEKNVQVNGGICIFSWDIMQLNEKNLQRDVFSIIYLKQTLVIFKRGIYVFACKYSWRLMWKITFLFKVSF